MKNKKKPSILFIGKRNMAGAGDAYCERAEKFIKKYFREYQIIAGKWGEPYPKKIGLWKGDYIISYLSPWIIKKSILKRAKIASINFHPGPPEYPGTGCFNFALYNNEKKYGVTCHIMEPKVDIGNIIKIRRFNISLKDNVDTLSSKSYIELYKLFQESIKYLFNHNFELPKSNFKWKRKPFKRTQLNELSTLKISMSKKEIFKRIRCTYLKDKPPPILKLYGKKFEYKE